MNKATESACILEVELIGLNDELDVGGKKTERIKASRSLT